MTAMLVEPFFILNKTSIVKLDVLVVFGTLSQNCSFSGICRVFVVPEQKDESLCCNCNYKAEAQLLFNVEEQKIGLAFDCSFIHTKVWKAFFSDFYFRVEEDWWSPPMVNSRLNVASLLVKKGTYTVFICEEGIRVWFGEEEKLEKFV